MKCSKCGAEIPEGAKFCTECGTKISEEAAVHETPPVQQEAEQLIYTINKNNGNNPKVNPPAPKGAAFKTFRLVLGIISIILFLIVSLQSCVAGAANALSSNGEVSGSAGFLLAICMLIAGIVTICLKKKQTTAAYLVPAGFYIVGALLAAANVGSYSDLGIQAVLASIFGALHVLFMFRSKNTKALISIIVPIVIVVIICMFVGISGSGTKDAGNKNTKNTENKTTSSTEKENETAANDTAKTPETKSDSTAKPEPDPDVPAEYKAALTKAASYSDMMHMSKAGIYHQLTSEYGEQFPAEAAQYAVDNLNADWNANALAKAKSYSDTMHMSKLGIYNQLISENGEQFTAEEAQYAMDNLKADWNANALAKAKDYQESMAMSVEAIREQLTSEYGEQFTAEEADYAISNLN